MDAYSHVQNPMELKICLNDYEINLYHHSS